jgi:prepilin-type N-terminal cleavage/methylation domain-containing protein/prepilin-type processing-associated H-X9-DG protein
MRRQTRGFTSGFTLVELLVVIGIIALLISILLPSLTKARQVANNVWCLSNMRQMGNAIAMYVNYNKGMLPYGYWAGGTYTHSGSTVIATNSAGASIGLGETDETRRADWTILLTQVMRGEGNTYQTQTEGTLTRSMFTDKDTITQQGIPNSEWVHYSAHPRLMPVLEESEHSVTHGWGLWPLRRPAKMASIKRSQETVLIVDGTQVGTNGNRAMATAYQLDGHNYDNWPSYQPSGGSYLLYDSANANNDQCINPGPNKDSADFFAGGSDGMIRWRHLGNKSANFLFVDGHCESRAYKSPTQCDVLKANVNTVLFY